MAIAAANWTGSAAPGSGASSWQTFTAVPLAVGMQANVNAVTGNLLLTVPGLSLPGVNGLNAAVTLHYNSLSHNVFGVVGAGWVLGTGRDVGLALGGVRITFYDETGASYAFTEPSSCVFSPPPGIDVRLACASNGYVLTMNHTQEQYQFNGAGYLISLQNRQGNSIKFTYDTTGMVLTGFINTEGQLTTFSYDGTGHLSQITDPMGRHWQYTADAAGDLIKINDPYGRTTNFGYDSAHNLSQINDPRGSITLISYNSDSRAAKIVRTTSGTNGPTYTFAYGSSSTRVTDPNNHTRTYGYDSGGRITSFTNAENHTTTVSWTADNHVAQQRLPSGSTTTYSYDSNNNLAGISLPTGAQASVTYDNGSLPYNPTSYRDTQGNATTYGYNAQGLLTSTIDALGHRSTATYYGNGTLASVTDPAGNVTSYAYNNLGLPSAVNYPKPRGPVSFTYNGEDLLASKTDGNGRTTTYSYDPDGEIQTIAYADGSRVSYGYDPAGNKTLLSDSNGNTNYGYNLLNQLTSAQGSNGTVSYTTDGIGNLLSKTDVGGTVTYGYGANDEVTSVSAPQGATTTIGYDLDGNRIRESYPNGVTQTLSYNSAEQIVKIAGAASDGSLLTSYSYSYINPTTGHQTAQRYSVTDAAGNLVDYGYNTLNLLTQAIQQTSSGSQVFNNTYGFDATGNMTSHNLNGAGTTMTYNSANELTQAGSTMYSYDGNGNQTGNSSGLSMGYNAQDQLTSLGSSSAATTSYAYTDLGQSKMVAAGSIHYQYDITGLSSQTDMTGTVYYTRLPDGTLVSERTSRGTYYYLVDGLGSVTAVVDIGEKVVDRYSYDPYGNVVSTSEQVANPFRFDGAYYDSSSKSYALGARRYDPTVARWTQTDGVPGDLSNPQSLNLYTFVGNNPINFIDPTGYAASPAVKIAAIAGGVGAICGAGAFLATAGVITSPGAVVLGGCAAGAGLVASGALIVDAFS